MPILDSISVGEKSIIIFDGDPVAEGFQAELGSIIILNDGSGIYHKTNVGLNDWSKGVSDISNISSVGTITTGTWNGSTIDIAYGGTGATTASAALNNLLPSQTGNNGKVLTTNGTSASWTTMTGGGGGGTVTDFSVIPSNGISASVSNSTTTPALTIGLGALTGVTSFNGVTILEDVMGGPSTITGAIWNGSTIGIGYGGTGAITASEAINNLLPSQTGNNGKVLTTDGTNVSWSTVGSGGASSLAATLAIGNTTGTYNIVTGNNTNIQSFDGLKYIQLGGTDLVNDGIYIGSDSNLFLSGTIFNLTTSSHLIINDNGGGTVISGLKLGNKYITLDDNSDLIQLKHGEANSVQLQVDNGNNAIFVGATGTNVAGFSGIRYLADPSANFTTLSLVHKGWITSNYTNTTDLNTALSNKYDASNPAGYITSSALTPYLTSVTAASTYLTITDAASTYQPIGSYQSASTNLTSLSTLSYVSTSFVKMTATGTFALDTNTYLTSNQTITLSGDVTGSGTTSISTSISNATVTGKLLTGYVSGAGTISATDSILSAIQKLNGNISALVTGVSSVNGLTGAINLTTSNISEGTNLYFTTDRVNTQVATYTGDVTLSGTVFSIGASKVTNTMLAGSIASSKLVGTDIATVGTITSGIWNATAIADTYISSSANWNTAFSERRQWDGGSTNLVAATGRTSLGATTVGSNLFTVTNPSAISFIRVNADNTVSLLDAATFRSAIGAGTGSGTVTSVTLSTGTTGLTGGSTITSSGTWTLAGTLVAANGGTGQSSYVVGDLLYADTTSTLAKLAGVATGNALISGGIGAAPSWGKIGLSTHVSGTLPIANGGTGQTTANAALNALLPSQTGNSCKFLQSDGTNTSWATVTPSGSNAVPVQSNPADPATTTSTTGVMMGLAVPFTPNGSGRILIVISGDVDNATTTNGSQMQIRTGTGTAPVNGAALTGTTRGTLVKYTNGTDTRGGTIRVPFHLNAVVTGLTLGTAIWVDIALYSITGGTSRVRDISVSIIEI